MATGFHVLRIIGALALAALLCACSAVKLGYNNIDEVAYWWMDGYVDFSDVQSPRVREDVQRLHLWHRANELPRYVELLQNMERLAPQDLTPAQACGFVGDMRERLNVFASQAEPAMVTLALGLEPAQLQHLERKYRRNNADYRKDWVQATPAQLKEKRVKQVIERSEMVYGRLEEAQRAVLGEHLDRSIFDAARNLAERERRQNDALQTLRKMAGQPVAPSEARRLLRGYLDRVLESPDAGYRAYQEALIQESCRSFAATHNATSPAQREAAVRRLRAYQRDLRELAAQR